LLSYPIDWIQCQASNEFSRILDSLLLADSSLMPCELAFAALLCTPKAKPSDLEVVMCLNGLQRQNPAGTRQVPAVWWNRDSESEACCWNGGRRGVMSGKNVVVGSSHAVYRPRALIHYFTKGHNRSAVNASVIMPPNAFCHIRRRLSPTRLARFVSFVAGFCQKRAVAF
jgi:hypothetical protein